jgi:hypothetical protein
MEQTVRSGPDINGASRKVDVPLIHSFDIFKIQPGGQVRWRGTQESFLTAKKYIQKIILSSPGQYIILNLITGDRVVLG